jgi:cell pole-organizing protein PopZ
MTQAQPEPSMEEILASIRRIISDDGEEEQTAPPAAQPTARPRPTPVATTPAAAAPTPARPSFLKREEATPEPTVAARDEDRAQTHLKTEDVEMIKKAAVADTDVVVDEVAATAASKAFQNLSQTVRLTSVDGGKTLEDLVIDMLRPMIKQWLDDNLAQIVNEKVETEVQRVARLRR